MAEQQKKPQGQQDVNQLLKVRREKLENLQNEGKDPFVITKYDVTKHSKEIKEHFDELENTEVSIAGRMMFKRVMGKASFCNIQDLSVEFCHKIGLDYVSCSPFRVPIARLAAAQAAIANK